MKPTINRRDFLQRSAGALALATLLPGAALAQDPLPARRKKAIMFGTVGGGQSVAEKFKMIKDAGFQGVEANSGMDRMEVLKARDAAGLEIPSVCDSVHWAKTLSDPNPATREIGLRGLITALEDCAAYGGSSVLLVPAVVNAQVSYQDAYTRSQAEIRKAIPTAEKLGVKIAIENVWNQFLLSPMEAARYVDEFESPAVGWHFDIGNVINYGWPEQWIRTLGVRIQKLHVKEFSRKRRDNEGLWKGFAVEYGEGDNNWPAISQALRDIHYTGWEIAEPAYSPEGVDLATRLHQVVQKMDQLLVP